MRLLPRIIVTAAAVLAATAALRADDEPSPIAGSRPRVIVSSDIGGTDPDDLQSMVHFLLYADRFDIEGLVSSPWGAGRREHILQVIDRYAADYEALSTHARYPSPDALRRVTKQGAIDSSSGSGIGRPTEGSEWIVNCARRNDARPLWVLVWGGIDDVAQALHDAPDIVPKLRVYFIGGPNKMWSVDAYDYIETHHPSLWMIEANSTYRGWFVGGDQSGEWANRAFAGVRARGRGALGDYFAGILDGVLKMGDSPSVGYLLSGASDDPGRGGWGGRFVRAWDGRKTVFTRLTTATDQAEAFGVVEFALPVPAGMTPQSTATMVLDGRIRATGVLEGGVLRFRFSPRDAKFWPYLIESDVAALHGMTGGFTAVPSPVSSRNRPSASHPHWWTDDPDPAVAEGIHPGARTVNEWRVEFLRDFAARLERCRHSPSAQVPASAPTRAQVLETMKRATTFMVERISTNGGYVWAYLPDLSRRWGEMEARSSMVWVQPPGTPTMGHLFLDAYYATGDEYYYRAADKAATALIAGQHPSGGWNYLIDTAGEASLQEWYDTVGRNGWRLEEFQHNWHNATFDDGGTSQSAALLLRLWLEKRDPSVKAALDKTIRFVLESQYPMGGWPQRFPLKNEFTHHGKPDYTSFITLNDDVAARNIEFLILCYQALGDTALLDPIRRGMDAFVTLQQPPAQAGWALQYTTDLKPSGARTYEPTALATHATGAAIEHLLRFYEWTGDARYLARIPEALAWLESVKLPPDVAAIAGGGATHPTFIEVGTNKALYLHRRGSNVVNGEYYVDGDPHNTIGHYSSFRFVDVAGLRKRYEQAKATPPDVVSRDSPLGEPKMTLPRFFQAAAPRPGRPEPREPLEVRVSRIVSSLDDQGRWIAELGSTSHPYSGDGSKTAARGDFSGTNVGDGSDTSPYRAEGVSGVSTSLYIRNMAELVRFVAR
jgi:PelA/Pel-15E family pectate lyase